MLLLLGFLLLVFLPSPWSLVAFAVCLALVVPELLFWRHRVRGVRVQAGAETLIGQRARVVATCRPTGQVTLAGELWTARCDAGADVDDLVRVTGREGLVLLVEPAQ